MADEQKPSLASQVEAYRATAAAHGIIIVPMGDVIDLPKVDTSVPVEEQILRGAEMLAEFVRQLEGVEIEIIHPITLRPIKVRYGSEHVQEADATEASPSAP